MYFVEAVSGQHGKAVCVCVCCFKSTRISCLEVVLVGSAGTVLRGRGSVRRIGQHRQYASLDTHLMLDIKISNARTMQ